MSSTLGFNYSSKHTHKHTKEKER